MNRAPTSVWRRPTHFLAFGLGFGAVGVWYGLALGLLVTSILMTWRWHRRERLGLVIDRV